MGVGDCGVEPGVCDTLSELPPPPQAVTSSARLAMDAYCFFIIIVRLWVTATGQPDVPCVSFMAEGEPARQGLERSQGIANRERVIAMLMGDCREVATAELCFYDWFYSVLKKTFL